MCPSVSVLQYQPLQVLPDKEDQPTVDPNHSCQHTGAEGQQPVVLTCRHENTLTRMHSSSSMIADLKISLNASLGVKGCNTRRPTGSQMKMVAGPAESRRGGVTVTV